MRTLALIPARAGSKGIPGKNWRPFNGSTLVDRAVWIGMQTCRETWISTDGKPIGNTISRPAHLCQDDTPMLPVIQHALRAICSDHDVIVLLQPTQPLRKPEHIKEALRLLEETRADSVVSVVQIPAHYSPDYAARISSRGFLAPFDSEWCRGWEGQVTRRQDARPAYSRDGTVYAIKRETIDRGSLYGSHCVPLIIPSNESCNLDTEEDWQRAEAMVRK